MRRGQDTLYLDAEGYLENLRDTNEIWETTYSLGSG